MPWELSVVNARDHEQPLGDRADVIARLVAALPGVELEIDPGPPPEFLAEMPPEFREHFLRPRPLRADFEGDGFVIQFYAANEPQIQSIEAEVRGGGNPVPALAALCQPNGWAVINVGNGAIVDLAASESAEWHSFRAWRDNAIEEIAVERRVE